MKKVLTVILAATVAGAVIGSGMLAAAGVCEFCWQAIVFVGIMVLCNVIGPATVFCIIEGGEFGNGSRHGLVVAGYAFLVVFALQVKAALILWSLLAGFIAFIVMFICWSIASAIHRS